MRRPSEDRLVSVRLGIGARAVDPVLVAAHSELHRGHDAALTELGFPAERGGYLDLHNFRNGNWKPARARPGLALLAEPERRPLRFLDGVHPYGGLR